MKKTIRNIKNSLLARENRLMALGLSLLGFTTGCESCWQVEYGVPYADFVVRGQVKSAATGQSIKGIQVAMQWDTAYTNENGEYEVAVQDFPENQSYTIYFRDVDGSENENLADRDTTLLFAADEITGKQDDWYEGKIEKTLDISLQNKTE